ncbi:DinB family protein [Priestia megaterium]|nr:DinB family protein [Priestia megaterium]
MNKNEQFRKEVLASVQSLSYEQLNKNVADDKWSVMQVLEHLYLMERFIVKVMADQLQNGENCPVDEKPFHLAVDRSRKVPAPPQVSPSHEKQSLEQITKKLKQSREALNQVNERVSEEELRQKSFPHPVLGLMDLKQWIEFIGYHEKRHLAQIEEIKNEIHA